MTGPRSGVDSAVPMKSILVVTRNLPPLWGGMEQLNLNLLREIREQHQVHVIAPRGARRFIPAGVTVSEVPLKPLPLFLVSAFFKTLWHALRSRPDLVLAGSGLVAPIAWIGAIVSRARSMVYLHGLDAAASHVAYRLAWIPVFKFMTRVIANSHATKRLARAAKVCESRVTIVHPGVELPAPGPGGPGKDVRARMGRPGGPVLLSVGRLTRRKGIKQFVADVLPAIVRRHPDALLVVVGGEPVHSLLAGGQSVADICAVAEIAGVRDNLHFSGVVHDREELAAIYSASDVHVFPIRDIPDDPEGFGMVAIEAAAYGLPTVAYATGGVVDAVCDGVSGRLVPSGDAHAFGAAVLSILERPLSKQSIKAFANDFSWEHFGERVREEIGIALATSRRRETNTE